MTGDLDAIYSREWVDQDFAGMQPEFDVVGEALDRIYCPHTAIDVGCGPGLLLRALRERGIDAVGLEGSSHCIAYAEAHTGMAAHIRKADLRLLDAADVEDGPFDLVVCTEVAEHIPEEHAGHLVALLCELAAAGTRESFVGSASRGWVVFTAAPPGQGGHDHVNERSMGYWIELFLAEGFGLNPEATRITASAIGGLQRQAHLARNLAVFHRRDAGVLPCLVGARLNPSFSLVLNHAPWVPERRAAKRRMLMQLTPLARRIPFFLHDTDYRQGGTVGKVERVDFSFAQWRWSVCQDVTHHLFCTDDLLLHPLFWNVLRAMVEAAPRAVIGLLSNHPEAPALAATRRFYATNSWVVGPCYVVPHPELVDFLAWPGTVAKDAVGYGWSDDATLNDWVTFGGPKRALHPIPTPISHERVLSTWGHTAHGDAYSHERVSWLECEPDGDMTNPEYWRALGGPEAAPMLDLPK